MKELFGIPIETLTLILAIMLAAIVGAIVLLALRNRVLVKLGVRNVRRRRARSALIVVGLMLGTTIIAAALATGDTMSHTIRATAVQALGGTDEVVAANGAVTDIPGELGQSSGVGYFPARPRMRFAPSWRGPTWPTESQARSGRTSLSRLRSSGRRSRACRCSRPTRIGCRGFRRSATSRAARSRSAT